LGDLEWQEEAYREEEELYRVNQEEQKRWFDQGIIRETDYLNAQTEHLLAVNRVLSARIDRRLYNLELRALFVSPENP
jgi:outer membrane protein TolC